jgi:hypothetical protein
LRKFYDWFLSKADDRGCIRYLLECLCFSLEDDGQISLIEFGEVEDLECDIDSRGYVGCLIDTGDGYTWRLLPLL